MTPKQKLDKLIEDLSPAELKELRPHIEKIYEIKKGATR